jgi:signal transduction histidine kinase
MQATPGIARPAWRGLVQVLSGSDPPPTWWQRSSWQRLTAFAALGATTLLLCVVSMAIPVGAYGQQSGSGRANISGSLISGFSSSSGSSSSSSAGASAGQIPGPGPGAGQAPCHLAPAEVICRTGADAFRFQLVSGVPLSLWLLLLPLVLVVVPLILAVRYPLLGWRIGWLGLVLVPALGLRWWGGLPWEPVQVLVLLAVLCVAGTQHDRPVLYWLFALTLVPWWFWAVRDGLGVIDAALGSAAFGAMAVAVDSVASRRRAQQILADQAELTELERARRAVLEERTRIARELHDVVAHHMSLMAVRAESAPHRLGALTDPVRAEFGALSGSAREALADMRRLLGVLRSDQPAARAPQPGLPDLPDLIDTARRAGMAVELSPVPAPDQVSPSTGVCAYRIIQEALSNVGQHAAGAPVTVSVRHDAATVTLRVANGPRVPAQPRANGHRPGHGLAGMRERAEMLGGSLSAGPAPDGGFVVTAVLPLSELLPLGESLPFGEPAT